MPEFFYIFVSESYIETYNNFQNTGTFTSSALPLALANPEFRIKYESGTASYHPFEPCDMDCKIISPYLLTATNDYRVEYDAEYVRRKYFPKFPSRFSAVYAFGDLETCQRVSQIHKWNISTVHKFKLLPNPLNRVIRVNMEIVSLARYAYRHSSFQSIEELWSVYWSGKDKIAVSMPTRDDNMKTLSTETIWEYLIEGVLIAR